MASTGRRGAYARPGRLRGLAKSREPLNGGMSMNGLMTVRTAATVFACVLGAAILVSAQQASAEESGTPFGLDFYGSMGEGRHSRYVPPVTNPIFNESPYITTEARAFYFYNELPNDFVTEGGHVHLVALQLRLALTERLAFIATKDGYADFQFDEVLEDEDGFANIAFGFKYAFYSNPEEEDIFTAGIRYEIPINDLESSGIELQGAGDGFLNPFLTGAMAFGDLGIQSSIGANLALNQDKDTSILHYSAHVDYEVFDDFFPLIEFNGFTPIDRADRLTGSLGDLDGVDVLNFGSEDRDTTLTIGGGFRYKFHDSVRIGFGGETPITDKDDSIMDYRLYFDLVLTL